MLPIYSLKPFDRVMQTLLHMYIVTRSPNLFFKDLFSMNTL